MTFELSRRPLRAGAAFDPLGHETPEADLRALQGLLSGLGGGGYEPLTAVEVGSYVGGTALAMAAVDEVTVHCVDHFLGNPSDRVGELVEYHGTEKVFRTFCRNAGGLLFRRVFPHRGASRLYAQVWTLPADLVFIDADHDYPAVKSDIELWRRHVRPGGVLCGHDYGIFPGVTRAADELGIDGVCGLSVWFKRL